MKLILQALFFVSLSALAEETSLKYNLNVSQYRDLLGIQTIELEKIFGKSQVKTEKYSPHEPDVYEYRKKVLVGGQEVFFETENNKIQGVFFRSPAFKTNKGISAGQGFCKVIKEYPEAEAFLDYTDGIFLILADKEEKIIFRFSTGYITADMYLRKKIDTSIPALCEESLIEIEIYKN